MKRIISIYLLIACFQLLQAQLMVDELGHVGIGIDTTANLNSQLSINSIGSAENFVGLKSDKSDYLRAFTATKLGRYHIAQGYSTAGYFGTEVFDNQYNIAINARAVKSTPISQGRSYGVLAYAGNATSGYNYGVFGCLSGTNNGAGVYGSATHEENGHDTGGRYAGYFYGNVKTTGVLTANSITTNILVTPSDFRLKENVTAVRSGALANIMNMNVVEYNYIEQDVSSAAEDDTATIATRNAIVENTEAKVPKKHFGFIAQELQEIYPELVEVDEKGYLGVNYLEVIPLLVRSIQELNAKLKQYENAEIQKKALQDINILYQNTPNPFTENTFIAFSLSKDVEQAELFVYDMNGEQIAKYPISERGKAGITIEGNSLKAGMYFYALIADGQVIDTKRMILTK